MAELGWRRRVEARKAAAMIETRGADGAVLANWLYQAEHGVALDGDDDEEGGGSSSSSSSDEEDADA
jgi:hypothetical protein